MNVRGNISLRRKDGTLFRREQPMTAEGSRLQLPETDPDTTTHGDSPTRFRGTRGVLRGRRKRRPDRCNI
jgi:hypothetical protein